MRVTVVGAGYVGLVSACCLAEMGNQVCLLEHNPARLQALQQGRVPIYEPGLETLLQQVLNRQLQVTGNVSLALHEPELILVAVGTPSQADGNVDLSQLWQLAEAVQEHLRHPTVLVLKSTVAVGTGDALQAWFEQRATPVQVVNNPEFLKEGAALEDFRRPQRILIGAEDAAAAAIVERLYVPFTRNQARVLHMRRREAEFSKYAANAFLASRISFMNELAELAEHVQVDIEAVRQGIGSDQRIGRHFIYAGCGYGGSCFPKDLRALSHLGRSQGLPLPLLSAIEQRNERQKQRLIDKLEVLLGSHWHGKRVALWGLAFKPDTDDIREAPALVLLRALLARGATVQAHDPAAMPAVAERFPEAVASGQLQLCNEPYAALENAHALCLLTEWKLFREPDWSRVMQLLAEPRVLDGRNQYDPGQLATMGFVYLGIGRGGVASERRNRAAA